MNKYIYKGKWKRSRGKVKQQWGKLTADRRSRMNGRYVELTGQIQEKYGYTVLNARRKYHNFLKRHDLNRKPTLNKRPG